MAYFTTDKSSQVAASPVAQAYVDILYDYHVFLSTYNGLLGPVGSMAGKTVGVVGAGAAGMSAAYLLAQQGAVVTVFEATNRVGGRVDSFHPITTDDAIFEMGAMRVPPSERVFAYFANKFGVKPGGQFPDPGKVDTNIIFQNKLYTWPKNGNAPSIFSNVKNGWEALAGEWMINVGNHLVSSSGYSTAKTNWQNYINPPDSANAHKGYSNISFYQGLVQAFVENAKHYGVKPWSQKDFALFGALGLGSGGFGPLYEVNFAEIARLVVNGLESDQQFYPDGLQKLITGFNDGITSRPGCQILPNCTVVGITPKGTSNGPAQITYRPNMQTPVTKKFDAVIVATTTRSMQIDMSLTDPVYTAPMLSDREATGIRKMHLMNSSKLFVLTNTKFWLKHGLPANIQTDGLVRGLYCLDYPGTSYGVVLISYTWGDDSTKYISIKDPQKRLNLLLNSLEPYVPKFTSALLADLKASYTKMVDWQDEPHYYGAFKLNYPGQDVRNKDLYFQFQNKNNHGVYLAGDSIGWCGGWIEGALQTGVNAASGVVNQLTGGSGLHPNSPYTQSQNLYDYGP